MSVRNEGKESKATKRTEKDHRRGLQSAAKGKGATKEELQERGGRESFAGAAGGRPLYAANPRQPHSITMLSRIQMTVISFGTPYT